MNLFTNPRQALAGLMAIAVALLLITLTFTSQPNAQADNGRGNGNSLLGHRGGGKSLQERMAKKLSGVWWGTIHDFPIADETAEGGVRIANWNSLVDFDADGSFNLTSTGHLGEVEVFQGGGIFLGAVTPLHGMWRATGKNTFEAVGIQTYRATGLDAPEGATPTIVFRVHLKGTIDGDDIHVPFKLVPLPCGNVTDVGFAFDQYSCGDASADIPAYDDVEAQEALSTAKRLKVTL